MSALLFIPRNWYLLSQLVKRDIATKFRGSVFGVLWSFFIPLLMLAVYTFVFSTVFKAKWPTPNGAATATFAVVLFAGLSIHSFLAEIIMRSPTSVLSSANLVKKVVFPLALLPVISVGTALFQFVISLAILFAGLFLSTGSIPFSVILIPLFMAPLALICIGLAWMFSAFGVYIRDVGQIISVFVVILCFLSPVFYPIESVPEPYRDWLYFSPITFAVEQTRNVMLWDKAVDWTGLLIYYIVGFVTYFAGFRVFEKLKSGFADVI